MDRPIIIEILDGSRWAKWTPKPDVTILRQSHTYYLMEVNSGVPAPSGRTPDDCLKLLLVSAFLVRFTNKFVSKFKDKNFVLVSDYIYRDATVDRYICFQLEGDEVRILCSY